MGDSITYKVHKHMMSAGVGNLFFVDDFLQFGSYDSVRQALARLFKKNVIKRAATGIYYIPKVDKWDGSDLQPSPMDIAKEVASRSNTRIVIDGQYAVNMLGLSTQVPGVVTFMTDGTPRLIKMESGIVLEFKHTSNMNWFCFNSDIMLLIVSAMKEIGDNNLRPEDMRIIHQHLLKVKKTDFEHDIKLAPQWVHKKLRKA